LLFDLHVIADRQDVVTCIGKLATFSLVGFSSVWLIVIWTITENADPG
jgi:hypothetical protein